MRNQIGLIALAVAILLSAIVYASATRYSVRKDVRYGTMRVFDRWTGHFR